MYNPNLSDCAFLIHISHFIEEVQITNVSSFLVNSATNGIHCRIYTTVLPFYRPSNWLRPVLILLIDTLAV